MKKEMDNNYKKKEMRQMIFNYLDKNNHFEVIPKPEGNEIFKFKQIPFNKEGDILVTRKNTPTSRNLCSIWKIHLSRFKEIYYPETFYYSENEDSPKLKMLKKGLKEYVYGDTKAKISNSVKAEIERLAFLIEGENFTFDNDTSSDKNEKQTDIRLKNLVGTYFAKYIDDNQESPLLLVLARNNSAKVESDGCVYTGTFEVDEIFNLLTIELKTGNDTVKCFAFLGGTLTEKYHIKVIWWNVHRISYDKQKQIRISENLLFYQDHIPNVDIITETEEMCESEIFQQLEKYQPLISS